MGVKRAPRALLTAMYEREGMVVKIKTSIQACLIAFGVLCVFLSSGISAEAPQSGDAQRVVALVDSAAALVESKGKDAFAEFRKKDSKWRTGKTYVFVDDLEGKVLVNPPSHQIEGKSLIDSKDAKGKFFMREFVKVAKENGSGWVDYWWPKPGEQKPSKKRSYLKRAKMPDGKEVIVGAGFYE
ncbi:MAG: cache domain-containing protein [Candidatus Binatia bacterium]